MGRTFALAVALALGMAAAVTAAVPVEGDGDLLALLRSAQETNALLYPSGRITVSAREEISGDAADATITWSGDQTRWDYTRRQRIPGPQADGSPRPDAVTEGYIIRGPGRVMWYSPGARQAQMATGAPVGAGVPDILDVTPEAWHRMDGPFGYLERGDWKVLLDPERAPPSVTKYVVSRAGGDEVIVERHYTTGNVLRITASLSLGGNVVSYERVPFGRPTAEVGRGEVVWNKGNYHWVLANDGQWRPSHFSCERRGKAGPIVKYTLDVSSFDASVRMPAQFFTEGALKLAPGTIVIESGQRERIYRIGRGGGEMKVIQDSQLDRLADSLRRSGFAAP